MDGPLKAAKRWGDLGADARELAQLRYGVIERPNRDVVPIRLPGIQLSPSDSAEMETIIERRLRGPIWREIPPDEARKQLFVSREFIARNSDGSALAVADLSHFSDHYDSMVTKVETLECFSASLLPKDYLQSMDLRSGYHHFRLHPDMRK
jgi:hypothetical protein